MEQLLTGVNGGALEKYLGSTIVNWAVYNKPIMITEFGCLNVGGKRDVWYEEALHQLPQKYPLVKSILFFHFSDDNTTTQQTINWYIIEDKASIRAITEEIAKWKTEE
jgi:hypothetical protein